MISNVKKHSEKSKLADKFQQPSAGPADNMASILNKMAKTQKRFKKRRK